MDGTDAPTNLALAGCVVLVALSVVLWWHASAVASRDVLLMCHSTPDLWEAAAFCCSVAALRVLWVLAALLWVAGIAVPVVAYNELTPGISDYFQNDTGVVDRSGANDLVAIGTALVGVTGLTAGMVPARRGR